jgi:hypothetical protein
MSTGSGRVAQAAQRAPLQQSGNAAAGVMARQDLIDRQMGAERALASQAQGPQQQAAQPQAGGRNDGASTPEAEFYDHAEDSDEE